MTCRPQTRGGRAHLGRHNHNRGGGLSSFSSLLVGQMKRLKKRPGKQKKKNKLDGINEIDATSKTALPPTASERRDALERCEKKDGGVVSVAWCCGASGVDGWYTPARTAPVRLLVEAEASPAFLRRARVWAQCVACTGKGEEEKQRKRGGNRLDDKRHRQEEDEERNKLVRAAQKHRLFGKSHRVKLLVDGYGTMRH